MSEWALKRFWNTAYAEQTDAGYIIMLDGKIVKSPAKATLCLPTEQLATGVAREWDAQTEQIIPASMPLTCTANAALDKISTQRSEIIDLLAAYGETDLLCYRAETPDVLRQRQSDAWDPLLQWAQSELNLPLKSTSGVMHIAQDPQNLERIKGHLNEYTAFQLAAAYSLISISGSLVLALAVLRGHLTAQDAWTCSRIDETWQTEQWGEDDEALEQAQKKQDDFLNAAKFYTLCST